MFDQPYTARVARERFVADVEAAAELLTGRRPVPGGL
jgi:hypothetical protein